MRTNIDIDDDLMRQAMTAGEETSKKATVEKALRLMINLKAQEGFRRLRGKVKWEGDLDQMRESRSFNVKSVGAQKRRKKAVA